MVVEELM